MQRRVLPEFPTTVKPDPLATAYLDSVELYFGPHLKRDELAHLRQHGKLEPCRPRWNPRLLYGWRLILNTPSRADIIALDRLARRYRGTVSRFDLALDIQCRNARERNHITESVKTQATVNWRRKGRMRDFEGTVYWDDFEDHPRPYRTLILYSDKPNRFTGEDSCVHFELKFLRPRAVKAQGVHRPLDLLDINPQALFAKHVRWSDAGAKHVQIATRKAARKGQNPRMLGYQLRRLGYDRAQYVKDTFPDRKPRQIPPPFSIPISLNWHDQARSPVFIGDNASITPIIFRKPRLFKALAVKLAPLPVHSRPHPRPSRGLSLFRPS
jgi:hypothetical protein